MQSVLTLRVGCIGVGHMAGAILHTLLKTGTLAASQLVIYDPITTQLDPFVSQGAQAVPSPAAVVDAADLILLAVKPQIMDGLLTGLGTDVSGKCFVSIAAGISSAFLRERLPGAHVIRVMPNATLTVGRGAAVIAQAPDVPSLYMDAAVTIFSCGGIVEIMPEEQLTAVVAVNGSSPAYFYHIVSLIASYACDVGIDPQAALRLAAKTMEGAAAVLLEGSKSPEELVSMVCTPGGTTEAAMKAMADAGLADAIRAGLEACTRRTSELSR